jgi:hypothetical protein
VGLLDGDGQRFENRILKLGETGDPLPIRQLPHGFSRHRHLVPAQKDET